MSTTPAQNAAPLPWTKRLHSALMPDYNRRATAYWWSMAGLGLVATVLALMQIAQQPADVQIQVAIGCLVASMAGFYPVRVPGSKNSFAAGEVFIFLLLLMHGPAAAVIAAAGEAFVGSMRSSKRWTSRLVSPALAAIAVSVMGWTLQLCLDRLQALGWLGEAVLLLTAMVFAAGYFLLNTALITVIPYLKRREPMHLHSLLGSFGWVGITYAASSLIAGLLYLAFRSVGIGVLVAGVPIIVMLLSMLHIYFRKREMDDAAGQVRLEVAEREAQSAARHVHQLRLSEQRFHSAFFNAAIGMALLSTDGRLLQANPALCALLGSEHAELTGRNFGELVHAEDAPRLPWHRSPSSADGATSNLELRGRHARGHEVWLSIHTGFFADGGDGAPCLILQAQDISARRSAESQLQHIAFHDSLTGLANRVRFRDSLAQAIHRCHADPSRKFAVMYLDFDRFKLINDTLGHSVGDQFLVAATQRILQHVRPHDLVGRLGGDEFAILLPEIESEAVTVTLAERLQAALCEPYRVGGIEVNSSASIGITLSTVGYHTADEVLRDADIAMYRAKSTGRAQHAVFDTTLRSQVSDLVQLEIDLRAAIDGDQLTLAYQPIYDLADGRIVSFEALARWQHPQRGNVEPDVFVPVAEECGLIGALTEHILARACRQLKVWHQLGGDNRRLRMQVNLSGLDLNHSELAMQVATTLLTNGLEASQLTLEITESKLMTGLTTALDTLTRLRDIGVGISVDDFGTGYSSLSYLSTLPISSLKVDRSFVHQMAKADKDTEIVKAVIGLGNALGKTVIAEGIETPAQLAQLRALGCRYGQGRLLAPPLSPEMAQELLLTGMTNMSFELTPPSAEAVESATVH
jgi:diguanylate cyclase (GGDEF)-like protein/PAS domain S-box-containing protein